MMETDLVSLIVGTAPIVALVSDRVAWNAIPQGDADPNITLFGIPGAPRYYLQGGKDGLEFAIVQMNVRATSFAEALAVRDALKARLSGFKGVQDATWFDGIFVRSERQSSEKPENTLYHLIQIDFDVWAKPV